MTILSSGYFAYISTTLLSSSTAWKIIKIPTWLFLARMMWGEFLLFDECWHHRYRRKILPKMFHACKMLPCKMLPSMKLPSFLALWGAPLTSRPTRIAQSGRQWVPHRRKGWFSTVLVQVVEVRIHSESTCDFLHARQRKISKIATYVEMSRLSVLACRSRRFCLWRSLWEHSRRSSQYRSLYFTYINTLKLTCLD